MSADPRYGCLLKEVKLENVSSGLVLFDDNFSTDNIVYVPPRCGQGTTFFPGYGYYTGNDCGYLNTCLNSPPDVQTPDPAPLGDIEAPGSSGGGSASQSYSSTKQVCVSCPDGFELLSTVPLAASSSTVSGSNNISATLGGQTWQIPYAGNGNLSDQNTSLQIVGQAGTVYSVTLRFRGVVEHKGYTQAALLGTITGSEITGTGAVLKYFNIATGNCAFQLTSPLPSDGKVLPGDNLNEYALIISGPSISDPTYVYLLNNGDNAYETGPYTAIPTQVDFQITVSIKAGATVTLTARTIDRSEWPNSDTLSVTSGPTDPPINVAPQPFPGQWLQMDTVSIIGGVVATQSYTQTVQFQSPVTADNYSITNGASATNYPTDWTVSGSNDGEHWTELDARTGVVFQAGQTNRYPIETPLAYNFYELVINATSDGNAPALGNVYFYAATAQQVCATGTGTGATQIAADIAAIAAATPAANALLAGNCFQVFYSSQNYTDTTTNKTCSASAKSFNSEAEAKASALALATDCAES